jgi:predicted porin
MKKVFLGSTALISATVMMAGVAGAAEAPTWKLTGNANFQFYNIDQDLGGNSQDHGWYFGVDEAELQLNVSATADNGLNYGFKVEVQTNTDDDLVADEARLQLSGGWGTAQLGDEDGAEDIMNYGGENLMGATGGFDGDFDDVLIRGTSNAPSYPTIAGDTGDHTKVSYFSPRFSGFQVGASLTPVVAASGADGDDGDEFKMDGIFENAIGLGANYENTYGDLRVRASLVYAGASSNLTGVEDVSAWSVGGIIGWGPFNVGANYTDNGDSGQAAGSGDEVSYWNVAGSFETGPIYLSAGYMSSTYESAGGDEEFSTIALTADYNLAPGFGVYGEIDMISDDPDGTADDNDATIFVAGANISF